jgi:Lecithin:cholesterol acyltransferase
MAEGNCVEVDDEGMGMGVLRHLVVVVPGIGGSVLTAPDGTSAWDVRVRALTHVVIDPGVLDIDREMVVTGLVDTLTVLRPWLVVPGYDGLTRRLRTGFGGRLRVVDYRVDWAVPGGVDVLRVPYDFRQSVAVSAEVLGRAVSAAVGDSGREVIVVAHSMGGLVARYWIGVCGGWRRCRALVTLGTPHRGAPRALDWVFNGAGVGGLRSRAATQVLRGWPSVFELLPQYPAVLPELGRTGGADGPVAGAGAPVRVRGCRGGGATAGR